MSAFLLWLENLLADLLLKFGTAIYAKAYEWFAAIAKGAEGEA